MATVLKIALIADSHHGIAIGTKLGSAALALMQPLVDWANAIRPDLVIELGDRINDLDKDADLSLTESFTTHPYPTGAFGVGWEHNSGVTPCRHVPSPRLGCVCLSWHSRDRPLTRLRPGSWIEP
jgi:hypothetical protein